MSVKLKNLTLRGFKSIRELKDFEPAAINVLIGANGAGKSNLIAFFRMLSWMMGGELQSYVARKGGASSILHDGAGVTPQIEGKLTLETDRGFNDYKCRLFYAADDTLIFADEQFRFSDRTFVSTARWVSLGSGHRESKLIGRAEEGDTTAKVILRLLRQCCVYQFHNTSDTSRMRAKWRVDDGRWLKEDGANLAPFLLRLKKNEPPYYRRIVETVRRIVPFFADFELEPEYDSVLLRWREVGSDVVFGASQASDGMLRALALVALLQQRETDLPDILFLDEPELGLHPYAINVIVGLLRTAAERSQVIVATQSTTFVDYFEPDEIVVAERDGRESHFSRPDPAKLQEWLEEYSMAELWEKNVIGGRPTR